MGRCLGDLCRPHQFVAISKRGECRKDYKRAKWELITLSGGKHPAQSLSTLVTPLLKKCLLGASTAVLVQVGRGEAFELSLMTRK